MSNENAFWQLTTQTFYPKKCDYLVDKTTLQPFTSVVKQRNENSALFLQMQMQTVDGCYGSSFFVMEQSITVDSSPYIEGLQAQVSVNFLSDSIQVQLPDTLIQSFPVNQPVNLVFGVYWSNTRLPTNGLSYINNVY